MNGSKSFLTSKTVWGGLIALVAGLAGLAGYAIGADEQAALVDHIDSLMAAIGGIIAIYGRVVATKSIG